MTTPPAALLDVSHLSVAYRQGNGWLRVVDDVNFSVAKGEVFGLVGESGCGKSTVALQVLGYRHPAMRIEAGEIQFENRNIAGLSRPELDAVRGERISFVPQNPTTALNPGMRVGAQVEEALNAHGRLDTTSRRSAELFNLVGLPGAPAFTRRYPHQLSGGQQQRVCIAMALACDPDFVVLDEPTTGLDVTMQEQIVALLISLRARLGMSMLYVTHDLGLLSQIADRVGVMYAGRMVEIAPTADLFLDPKHPYTRGLIASVPRLDDVPGTRTRPLRGYLQRKNLPPGCPFAPRCEYALPRCFEERQELEPAVMRHDAACWRWKEIAPLASEAPVADKKPDGDGRIILGIEKLDVFYGTGRARFRALRDISLGVRGGETFALVGESGSGKSTLARAVSGLVSPIAGDIRLDGKVLARSIKHRTPQERRLIQYIFQNPDASLNPRSRVGVTLARPFAFFFGRKSAEIPARVESALSDVRLDESYAKRFPDQLSGGERQRVAIARALIAEPSILLCDEILSALDVSVQANILTFLRRLKAERSITMVFISHDLAVVRALADRVCVLFRGEIMELGTRDQVFAPPYHPYTYSLLQSVPTPLKRRHAAIAPARTQIVTPSPAGCAYAGRCPWQIGTICETERPPWRETPDGLGLRCHIPLDDLTARAAQPLAEAKLEPAGESAP